MERKIAPKQDITYYENEREDVQQLINPNSKRILDVGCGKGRLGAALKNKLNAEVWGVEYVNDIASIAQNNWIMLSAVQSKMQLYNYPISILIQLFSQTS